MHTKQTLLITNEIETTGRLLSGEGNSGTRQNLQPRIWEDPIAK